VRTTYEFTVESTGNVKVASRTSIIPEGDVNRLISRSRLPAAVEIQDWWFDEVIPTIRRTGGYGRQGSGTVLTEKEALRAALAGWDAADALAATHEAARLAAEARHLVAAKQVADLSNQNVGLSQELYTTRELAAYAQGGVNLMSALLATPGGVCLRDAANQIEQPQHAFNIWLKDKDRIYENN
jgi:prophage antirepressor-like protein